MINILYLKNSVNRTMSPKDKKNIKKRKNKTN